MKLSIKAGTTSVSVNIFVANSSSTTGAGLTGLAYNTASLTAYYTFAGSYTTAAAITLATLAAVNSAWSSGGFKEVDSTNLPGVYRLDLPDAVLAASKGRSVLVYLKGATNMAPTLLEIELTGWDNQDTVRGGLTALPNVASGSAGAIITSGTGTAQLNVSGGRGDSNVLYWNSSAVATPDTAGYPKVTVKSGTGTGELNLSGGRTDANMTYMAGGATAVSNLANAAAPLANDYYYRKSGTVDTSTFTATTTQFETSITTDADLFTGANVFFYGGSAGTNSGANRKITGYSYGNGKVKLTIYPALPVALSSGAAFVVCGMNDPYTTATAPTAATVASAVRTELNTELGRVDVAISTRLASASYVAPPEAATVAGAVRTELTTELGRIDANVSSRLSSASYVLPDNAGITATYTASVNAALYAGSVDGKLTTQRASNLDNLDAAISTRLSTAGYSSPPTAVAVADAILGRNISAGSDGGRTVKQALSVLRNKVAVVGDTLTVYDTDDTTALFTATVGSDSGANPITSIDPA